MIRFFLSLILFTFFLRADTPSLLKESDINRIMQEIFSQHVDKKEMSGPILKASIRSYLEQFDPERIYFLESEVQPYLSMNDEQLNVLVSRYKKGDYTAFKEINKMIQKAILRAQNHRGSRLKSVLNQALNEGFTPQKTFGFAKNVSDLDLRQDDHFREYVARYAHRFGKAAAQNRADEVIAKYNEEMLSEENPYLYLNQENKQLSQADEENLFSLHVLKALASSLDSHTKIYNPKEAYDMKVRLEKGFEGIGLVLSQKGNKVVIDELVDKSPAQKSGLINVGDTLIEVNGTNIQGLDFDDVMSLMRGQKGSDLTITVLRNDKQFVRATLKKETIVVDQNRVNVASEKYGNGIIGIIKLDSFYQGDNGLSAEKDVRDAIEKLDQQNNLRGLILDLRDNNGGFLTQAVRTAGLFITNGIIVISKYSNGEEKFYRDMDGKQAFKGPLIVLVSKETASAAEIVAQALQDYGVALIVGDEHTYGKGTIQSQTVTDKQGSSSYFKVTVGKYYTVSGKTPQVQGVKSDIVVPGPLDNEQIGEEYLEYSLSQDTIPSAYKDNLTDIDPNLKEWYLKYYTPTLQTKETEWKNFVPDLKKNSGYRLTHNKNYQLLLKEDRGETLTENPPDNVELADLQLEEAVNIMKDMIYLDSKSHRTAQPKP